MAGPLPIVFRGAGASNALVDWVDLTAGAGYKRFYCCASKLNAGNSFYLSSQQVDAKPIEDGGTQSVSGWVQLTDTDYDITLNVPATIANANAFINVTSYMAPPAGETDQLYVKIIIKHYDGSTETSLGSAQGVTHSLIGDNNGYYRDNILISLTEKRFARGDILRVTVELHTYRSSSTGSYGFKYYIDPNSSLTFTEKEDGRTIGSDLTVDIPFKVDI